MQRAPAFRLRSRQDFDRVFGRGRAIPGRFLVLRVTQGSGERARVGVAVGRQLGTAVVRNRMRRRLREVVRLGPPLRAGWDVVLIARAACRDADWSSLVTGWREAVRRAGLCGDDPGG